MVDALPPLLDGTCISDIAANIAHVVRSRFRNANRLVDYSVQYHTAIVSVVSIYDMCLRDQCLSA